MTVETLKKKIALWQNKIALILLAGVIIGLRTWKVAELFNFTFSEEMQAVMAWEQVKNWHPIWIGVSAANIYYYLGPGFTYLNAILFKLFNGDPASLAWFSALLGLATTFSIYWIISNCFTKRIALYSATIYGCSMLINLHDRRFWNPTPIPFITIWMIFSLIKAKNNPWWLILTAGLIGAAFHTHLTLLLFIVPTAYVIFLSLKKNNTKTNLKVVILSFVVYLLATSPLIIFDINHNFDNLMMPIRTLRGQQKAALDTINLPNTISHLSEISSAFGRLWYIKSYSNPQDEIVLESHMDKTKGNLVLSIISFGALFYFLYKFKNEKRDIFFISIVTILGAFIIYPSYNLEYYLMSLFTLLTVAIGYSINALPKKLAHTVIVIFVIVNIFTTATLSGKYGLNVRKRLIEKTMPVVG